MDTRVRGDIAEAAILHALTAAGLLVLTPFGRFGPYDLVVETAPGTFVRVQVKSGRLRGGCVEFNCRSTDHGRGAASYVGRADVFGVHVHDTGASYIVPMEEALASKMYLRVDPAANNQQRGIRRAADYRLADWAARAHPSPVSPRSSRSQTVTVVPPPASRTAVPASKEPQTAAASPRSVKAATAASACSGAAASRKP